MLNELHRLTIFNLNCKVLAELLLLLLFVQCKRVQHCHKHDNLRLFITTMDQYRFLLAVRCKLVNRPTTVLYIYSNTSRVTLQAMLQIKCKFTVHIIPHYIRLNKFLFHFMTIPLPILFTLHPGRPFSKCMYSN